MSQPKGPPAKFPALAYSADNLADAALLAQRQLADIEIRCDACDRPLDGEPAGRGLYMWARGDECRFEEPALCDACATAIGVTAQWYFTLEDEGG